MHTVTYANHTITSAMSLGPSGPDLAVRVFNVVPHVDGGGVYYADVLTNAAGPVFPDSTPKMTRQTQLYRLLENPVQIDGWVMEVTRKEGAKLYEKTKRIVLRQGALPIRESAPEFGQAIPSMFGSDYTSTPAVTIKHERLLPLQSAGLSEEAFVQMLNRHIGAAIEKYIAELIGPLEHGFRGVKHMLSLDPRVRKDFAHFPLVTQALTVADRQLHELEERLKPECFKPVEPMMDEDFNTVEDL